jgi:hypothetical protein
MADLCSMCLVSRCWKNSVAPRLWETFKSDLRPTSKKTFGTLLHPQSGILPHIRALYTPHDLDQIHGEYNLRLLISAIPRDALRNFTSDLQISQTTLQPLLQSHRKLEALLTLLESFSMPQISGNGSSDQHMVWMKPLLSCVASLYFGAMSSLKNAERVRSDFRFLTSSNTVLEKLQLIGWDEDNGTDYLDLGQLVPDLKELITLSKLTLLRFHGVDLSASPKLLLGDSKPVALQKLMIDRCASIEPFLDALNDSLSSSSGQLSVVSIILENHTPDSDDTVATIERFLIGCPGLVDLELDVCDCRLVNTTSILRHCETLVSLSLGTGNGDNVRSYSPADIQIVIGRCARLRHLGINFADPKLGDIEDLASNFALSRTYPTFTRTETPLAEILVS